MSKPSELHSVTFGRTAPTIPVTDIEKSLDFYIHVLGFKNVFQNGNPVGFVILVKDSAEIHLTLKKEHKATDRNVFHMMISDASALYQYLESKNVKIIKGLRTADYGLKQFVFCDPDHNRIDVGEDVD
jgi:catechol 2,3-dioxygenase-like lactoylglutathione lyase family enzyme